MSRPIEQTQPYCIFEYFYCDAGNWSTTGVLLLTQAATDAATSDIENTLEPNQLFVAEQVGIPSLCPKHFADCGATGPSDLDHAFHTFATLRTATQEEILTLPIFGRLNDLVQAFLSTKGHWDVRLSPNVSW